MAPGTDFFFRFAICMLFLLITPVYSTDESHETTVVDTNMTTIMWNEFEELKALEGQSYLDARDRLLAMPDIEDRLRPYFSSDYYTS